MLARIQQFVVVSLLLMLSFWVTLNWSYSFAASAVGWLILAFGHSAFLAIEFVLGYWVNRQDPCSHANFFMLVRAWIGEALTAPRVFCWQQPFRSNLVPDCLTGATSLQSRRGVVLIHGLVCNRGFWNPWLAQLKQHGRVFSAVNLEPVFGAIDLYVPVIEEAVQRVTAVTGLPPLLVCHSMGGLAVRAWLRARQADHLVHRVVTIGTPHQGTWLGRFSPASNGRQMRLASPWLEQLASAESRQRYQLFTCYYSNCDNIVFPASVATLSGADNRLVAGVAHVALAFDKRVMSESLAMLG